MLQYFGISAMIVICSMLATIVYIGVSKKGIKYSFYIFSAFFAFYVFLLSGVKYYLGYSKENLFESFWDVQAATYIHYGIPMLIAGTVVPVVFQWIFKEAAYKIIRFFDSTMFGVLVFVFFLVRKINNRTYCIAFLIALVVSTLAIAYVRKNEIKYVWGKDIKKHFKNALSSISVTPLGISILSNDEHS